MKAYLDVPSARSKILPVDIGIIDGGILRKRENRVLASFEGRFLQAEYTVSTTIGSDFEFENAVDSNVREIGRGIVLEAAILAELHPHREITGDALFDIGLLEREGIAIVDVDASRFVIGEFVFWLLEARFIEFRPNIVFLDPMQNRPRIRQLPWSSESHIWVIEKEKSSA